MMTSPKTWITGRPWIVALTVLAAILGYLALLILCVGPRVMPQLTSFTINEGVTADRVTIALDSLDRSISMLTTIGLGLFVIVGGAVGLERSRGSVSGLDVVLIGGFLLAAMTSLYFGYLARMVAVLSANYFVFPVTGADSLIALEALTLSVEAAFASTVAARRFLSRDEVIRVEDNGSE